MSPLSQILQLVLYRGALVAQVRLSTSLISFDKFRQLDMGLNSQGRSFTAALLGEIQLNMLLS